METIAEDHREMIAVGVYVKNVDTSDKSQQKVAVQSPWVFS